MSLFTIQKPDYLASGERARLIPTLADTRKEGRITSSTLAAFMSVDEFAKSLLDSVGVRLGKTSKVECFTEIVFRNKDRAASNLRPDGLIVVTTGKKQWSALIEAKIGKAELLADQVESYLDLAKEHKIDAVITISNQFAASATHHPLTLKKTKTRNVDLFHWSWTYLIAEAVMWVKYHGVTDPDQAYILEELVRYLQHDSSGVLSFDRMNSTWKDVCSSVQNRITLKKNSVEVLDSVGSWHQFVRNLSLLLSLAIGENATIYLKKAHRDDANKRLEDDASQLATEQQLTVEYDVPDAASRIKLVADVGTRSVMISMRLKAPDERSTSKGRINWFVGQLKQTTHPDIAIRASWPSRAPDTMASLSAIREHGIDVLLCDNASLKPIAFEVVLMRDLGAKFKGARTFIQESEPLLLEFYEQAGQHLKDWVAPPPKVKTKNAEVLIEDVEDEVVQVLPQPAEPSSSPIAE
ncbi:MAG: hypothetical protein ACJAXQ_000277 [Parvibaculaceae bacterium]|jgi:hypothetical protein